ncbi:hypothetical protein EJ110_NYTH34832 [Nymphaea thermarum]|nr:hypothetical protein EJ110_NYTH34832 [Nymphaea thermarum]
MNAGGAFGGNRGLKPVPPEKGVFPLDHLHECDVSPRSGVFGSENIGPVEERADSPQNRVLDVSLVGERGNG